MPRRPRTEFYRLITEAVNDIATHGFDSLVRVQAWMARLREAARASLIPEAELDAALRQSLRAVYQRYVESGRILRDHNVSRFTLEKVKPQLRLELDRRILTSASLIKLNRERAIEDTLQRFQGWATSIPKGGSRAVEKSETKQNIRKSIASLPFEERRVLIDQGHKFVSSLSETLAHDGGAIAAVWRSRYRQAGYNYRRDHKERDGRVYTVRGNWALERGLMKAGEAGYTDEITKPGQEVFCRCSYEFQYHLRDLPDDMLTAKGRAALAQVSIAA